MKFNKDNFEYFGGFLTYLPEGNQNELADPFGENAKSIFIARFKYNGPVKKHHFITALKNHFTVEEWVELMEKHDQCPTTVVDSKIPNWSKNIIEKWQARQEAKFAKRHGRPLNKWMQIADSINY